MATKNHTNKQKSQPIKVLHASKHITFMLYQESQMRYKFKMYFDKG